MEPGIRAKAKKSGPLLDVLEAAEQRGWEIGWTRNSHIRLMHKNGGMVITGSTASDWRAVKNLRSELRKEELNPSHRRTKK
jgi:hypothetical protein